MEFKTAISKLTDNDMIVRGKKQSSLIKDASFSDAIFLLLASREPSKHESRLFGAMLTAIIDHGMGTASALSTRFVASTGNSVNAAVAAGVLALGDYHGGAIEQAMRQLQENAGKDPLLVVRSFLAEKQKLYGFGHKVYEKEDPRVTVLKGLCEELHYESAYVDFALAVEAAIEQEKGKRVVLNIDGFIAAVLLEMGFPPTVGKGFFIIGRVPGLVAHAMEEQAREQPVRRLAEEEITYDGL